MRVVDRRYQLVTIIGEDGGGLLRAGNSYIEALSRLSTKQHGNSCVCALALPVASGYGRTRAALTAVVTRYRAKGALRDVGKVMGLPEDLISLLSKQIWGWSREVDAEKFAEAGIDLTDRRIRLTLDLARALIGVPRHLSQHPGGFVLTHDRLDELVPIEPAAMDNRQTIEWDKDDIDALKIHEGGCAGARHADLHEEKLRPAGRA